MRKTTLKTTFPTWKVADLVPASVLFFAILVVLAFQTFPLNFVLGVEGPRGVPSSLLKCNKEVLISPINGLDGVFPATSSVFGNDAVDRNGIFFISDDFHERG